MKTETFSDWVPPPFPQIFSTKGRISSSIHEAQMAVWFYACNLYPICAILIILGGKLWQSQQWLERGLSQI